MGPPRVLVVRAGALGDVLLLRPAIAGLSRAGFDITFLAPSAPARLLEQPGHIDVWSWEGPEVASLLSGSRASAPELTSRFAGVTAALVVSRSEELLAALRARVPEVAAVDPFPPAGVHAGRWYAQGAARLGADAEASGGALKASAEDRIEAERLLQGLGDEPVVLHPGSGSRAKNWPARSFAALAAGLPPVAIVGGPADGEALHELGVALPRAIRLESPPLRVLGAILARARLYVGNDSGVSHLAAAYGAPTLALFGPTDPAVWAPIGPRVVTLRAPDCDLGRLDVAVVRAAADRVRSEGR